MAVEIIFPRVDMDMTSGRVSRWLVDEGSAVDKGDPLFEIETDKAAMEIDAPASGILRGIRAADGDEIQVGTAVGWIVAEGESWEVAAPADALPVPDPAEAEIPTETIRADPQPTTPQSIAAEPDLLRATPLARREAQRLGIDLSEVQGSGPRGRVVMDDILATLPADKPEAVPALARRPLGDSVGSRTHRQWLGSKAGTPLVFLHGFGSDQTSWRGLWTGLEASHRILAIDLPGHGRSNGPSHVSFDSLVDTVQAVLDEEGITRLHLVGHSLGGAIALGLVESGLSDIRSLCLIAPAGLGPDIDGAFLAGLVRSEREESLTPWLRRLFADPAIVTQGFVRATLRGRSNEMRSYQAALSDAIFPDGTQAVSLRHILERLTIPTKVIWGTQDSIIPLRHARRLPGRIALHTVPTGHMPHMEEAALVAALITELVRSAAS